LRVRQNPKEEKNGVLRPNQKGSSTERESVLRHHEGPSGAGGGEESTGFFDTTAGLVLAQVVDPATAERLVKAIAGIVP
jgi:hypothetical protein